ncbi:fructose bisphosphate aldolase [Longivirga aurantiaca]|uniref:fructose-bisphosphate aldolase n=1 Tax=Longivirga aurantiaca TaxID=1837743 RepID=A0ABW1T057_9ACTN
MDARQLERMRDGAGFIAALDQSGGSTPRALALYGLDQTTYRTSIEMLALAHRMRTRIVTSPAFTGERIIGSILFGDTMERHVEGMGTAEYLWHVKEIVPFLKVDHGLEPEEHGVRLMRRIPDLDRALDKALGHGVFGTKMRSVVVSADRPGIEAVVRQQFEFARRILDAGLVPIIEPEVDIRSLQKEAAEDLLREYLLHALDMLGDDDRVMLKLTLPEVDDYHAPLVAHPNVLRVVALSGGYSRAEAVERLDLQHGVIASFSRALTEGLRVEQTKAEFDAALHESVESIYRASLT